MSGVWCVFLCVAAVVSVCWRKVQVEETSTRKQRWRYETVRRVSGGQLTIDIRKTAKGTWNQSKCYF
uniref:Secreted protein n=1 Tax=Anopheles quadriannulatus TaxID=34691 RepID=A0A182XTP2_ANOQN